MTFNAASVAQLFAELRSRAETLSVFDKVYAHEPRSAPGLGLTYAFWGEEIKAVTSSGLATTTCLVMFTGRVYCGMLAKPEDDIDLKVMSGAASVIAAYSSGFTLDGNAREVDLLGQFGEPLSAVLGYLEQEGKQFRVANIPIPVVVDDAFPQGA